MATSHHHLVNNHLLWVDGSITVPSDEIASYLHLVNGTRVFVDKLDPDIEQFNSLSDSQILVKDAVDEPDTEWDIPSEILDIDLMDYFIGKLAAELDANDFSPDEVKIRSERLVYEYNTVVKHDMTLFLYATIHVINRFIEKNIVWGVGRGSSTSSYLLYLIGLHDVDSVKYELDFAEFMH